MNEPGAHLLDLEVRLARRTMPFDEVERVIADEFFEFGRSGRRWTRSEIIEGLARSDEREREIEQFEIHQQGADIVLATYSTKGGWRRLAQLVVGPP